MSAILVLLALLSVATIASRRGYAAFVASIVQTPILLAVGLFLSPRGLAFFTQATTEAMLPALRVGAAWLALLVGMRAVRPHLDRGYLKDLGFLAVVITGTWLVLGLTAYGGLLALGRLGLGFEEVARGDLTAIGAAVLLGGIVSGTGFSFAQEALGASVSAPAARRLLFLARHDDLCGALALCAAIWLWPLEEAVGPIYTDETVAMLAVIGLGATLAVAQLLAGSRSPTAAGARIPLIGLLVFAAGLSTSTMLPEAAIAFFFGGVFALSGRGVGMLRGGLSRTERPVRFVVLTLVGTHIAFPPGPVLLGVVIAVARLVVKSVLRSTLKPRADVDLPLGGLLGSSGIAIPFALSFAFTRPLGLSASEVLTTTAVAVSLSDLMTLIVWRRAPQEELLEREASDVAAPPGEEEEEVVVEDADDAGAAPDRGRPGAAR